MTPYSMSRITINYTLHTQKKKNNYTIYANGLEMRKKKETIFCHIIHNHGLNT